MPNTKAKEERRAPQVPPRSSLGPISHGERKDSRMMVSFFTQQHLSAAKRAETHSTMLLVVICGEGLCKINVPLFENSRQSPAMRICLPLHSKSANFGMFKLNSLNLAPFPLLNPVHVEGLCCDKASEKFDNRDHWPIVGAFAASHLRVELRLLFGSINVDAHAQSMQRGCSPQTDGHSPHQQRSEI